MYKCASMTTVLSIAQCMSIVQHTSIIPLGSMKPFIVYCMKLLQWGQVHVHPPMSLCVLLWKVKAQCFNQWRQRVTAMSPLLVPNVNCCCEARQLHVHCSYTAMYIQWACPNYSFFLPIILFRISQTMLLLFPRISFPLFPNLSKCSNWNLGIIQWLYCSSIIKVFVYSLEVKMIVSGWMSSGVTRTLVQQLQNSTAALYT